LELDGMYRFARIYEAKYDPDDLLRKHVANIHGKRLLLIPLLEWTPLFGNAFSII
jgi:hypothetical protein